MFQITTICHKTDDSKHPLLMLTNREGCRYFFGKIPEGTQRVLNENGVKLGKLKSIFLTGTVTSWSEIGGLPGLFLTISDATSRGIDVFTSCTRALSYVVSTWRYFVFRKGIPLNILDAGEKPYLGDSSALFRPVKIQSSKPRSGIDDNTSSIIHRQLRKLTSLMFPVDTDKVNDRNPESYKSDPADYDAHTHVKLPCVDQLVDITAQESLSFVIRFLPIRGKFDPVRAKELGVEPGFKYRRLTNGESVETKDGTVVHPHQVVGPSKSLPKLVIIDVPNASYVENTVTSSEWFVRSEDAGDEEVGLVYHMLGDDVDFKLERYLKFLKKFPSECQHVISHASIADNTLVFKTYAAHLLKLKLVLVDNFTLPNFENHVPMAISNNTAKLQSLQTYTIDPTGVSSDLSNVTDSNWAVMLDKEGISEIEKKNSILAKSIIPLESAESTDLKEHVQIVTLGTGSALPAIHRNVLSNLLRIPLRTDNGGLEYRAILLDGGENTFGSMMRNFGHMNYAQLEQVMSELSLIFLSHLHADHHLGIVSVINAWFEVNKNNSKKLHLVIPWQYDHFLDEWYDLEASSSHVDLSRIIYTSCEDFMANPERENIQMTLDEFEKKFDAGNLNGQIPRGPTLKAGNAKLLFEDLGILNMETVRAIHCYWAYSVSITFNLDGKSTFKVSFSGDTRPNPRFAEIGSDSDLLIHEASLDNELIEEAIAKKHTTVIEAIRVGQLMNCPNVVLTHFSTRFSEKANFVTSLEEYNKGSSELEKYLGNLVANIFNHQTRAMILFDKMNICYAFDHMTVNLRDVGCQKPHFKAISALSTSEQTEIEKVRMQKEAQKTAEKREAKRLQRIASQRKRRHDI